MSKHRLIGVVFVVAFATSVQAAHAGAPDPWRRMTGLRRGERIAVTTVGGEQPAVFVTTDSSSLAIAGLGTVSDERTRKAISRAVREAATVVVAGDHEVNGVAFRVVRLEKDQVLRVTRLSERGSPGVTTAATAAAAVAGLYLGAFAGMAVNGGVLAEERGGSVVCLGIAIAVPTAIGLAVHSATKRPYIEVLYSAPAAEPLGDADWRAVENALPASLRQAAGRK